MNDLSSHDENAPLPIDMDTVREVAAELSRDHNGDWLTELVEPDFDGFHDLVAALRDRGFDPEQLYMMGDLCAKALGGTGATRVLHGDRRMETPFFHHGDLVVKGHLDVVAPFVITGSLTVEGVLADAGPYSIMIISDDVRARAVFTNGDMSVSGDIEADLVYGHYNDHTLQAATIHARLVIEDDHYTIANVEADAHFDLDTYQQGHGDGVQEELRELLVDEVFGKDPDDDEEMLDQGLLFTRLREGLPVFRGTV